MIIIILMITSVFIRNMLALTIMIVSMTTCAEVSEYAFQERKILESYARQGNYVNALNRILAYKN